MPTASPSSSPRRASPGAGLVTRAGGSSRSSTTVAVRCRSPPFAATQPAGCSNRTSTARSRSSATTMPGSSCPRRADLADATWEYDELGRLSWERTPHALRSFRYDDAHQLVELIENGAVTAFEYDARGRRVRATGAHDIAYVWGERHLDAVVVDGVLRRFDTDADGRLRRAGDSVIEWDTSFATPRPVAIDDQRLLTVDATTVGAISTGGAVEWRPFKLTDAWGGASAPSGATSWHDYFGIEAYGLVWLGGTPLRRRDPPIPGSRPAGSGSRASPVRRRPTRTRRTTRSTSSTRRAASRSRSRRGTTCAIAAPARNGRTSRRRRSPSPRSRSPSSRSAPPVPS